MLRGRSSTPGRVVYNRHPGRVPQALQPCAVRFPSSERRAHETLTADRKHNGGPRSREVCSLLRGQTIHLINQPWAGICLESFSTVRFVRILHRSLASGPSRTSFVIRRLFCLLHHFRLRNLRSSSASGARDGWFRLAITYMLPLGYLGLFDFPVLERTAANIYTYHHQHIF